ncbi:MAG: GerAB/ArcD/ProY family transporter [Oscillospiraceae bacterium]|nr:GerAB/ArcD/ProY family transporter [Oscillospiraceae bacterium]
MDSTKGKINTFQFFSLLFLTRLLTTVTYIPSYMDDVLLSDVVIQTFFRFAFGIIIMIPMYLLYRRYGELNIIDIVRQRSAKLAKITALIYAGAFFYFTLTTVARLDVFAGTIVFPESDINYFLIFVVLIGCYGAYLGFEALGRSAVLSLALVAGAMVFILATLIKKMDFLNFTPVFYNGVSSVAKISLDAVGRTIEYSIIAVSLPKVTGNKKNGFFFWISAQTLVTGIIFFFEVAVMGNFTSTQLFPVHSLASLAEFSMFGRLDAIITGVWILCAFLKISLLIYLKVSILKKEFGEKKPIYYMLPIGIALSAINLYVSMSVGRFAMLDSSTVKMSLTLSTAFFIPLIVLIISGRKKEGENCKKSVSSQR